LGYGSPFDFLYYRPSYSYYASSEYRPGYDRPADDDNGGVGTVSFIESFFSYVFGDGDPNVQFSNEQLRYLADVIRKNGGVVVAAQMAPYLDPPPVTRDEDVVVVDEAWVLPAVLQLGGAPVATADGDIVYRFDALAAAGAGVGTTPASTTAPVPIQLYEKVVPFSGRTSPFQRACAGLLGALNLGGALWLGQALVNPLYLAREPTLVALLSTLYPPLLGYAVLYNVVPLLRAVGLARRNAGIAARNERRRQWAEALTRGGGGVRRKLLAAAALRRGEGGVALGGGAAGGAGG
jgi:hypothetical protein